MHRIQEPTRALIWFDRKSRDRWKQKYQALILPAAVIETLPN